jgi:hypothetical protein
VDWIIRPALELWLLLGLASLPFGRIVPRPVRWLLLPPRLVWGWLFRFALFVWLR